MTALDTARARVPEARHLLEVLARLASEQGTAPPVELVERRPNPSPSTYPTEIVVCRLADGTTRELFCKYSSGFRHSVYGHRGDVAYEAAVYGSVLTSSPVPTVGFFGHHESGEGTWLVLDHLDGAARAGKAPDGGDMPAAAEWAGRFHAAHEGADAGGLTRYDAAYYRGWLERARRFATDVPGDLAWLAPLEDRFDSVVAALTAAPQTVIHGEYYPRNVLIAGGRVNPVDWESAAVGPGEIDLAMLTEGWDPEATAACERAYAGARWPEGAPRSFPRVLGCARVYVLLRWLGDRPEWTRASSYRFDTLHAECELLGLVGP